MAMYDSLSAKSTWNRQSQLEPIDTVQLQIKALHLLALYFV